MDVADLLERIELRMNALALNDNKLSQAVAGTASVMRDIRRGKMPSASRLMKLAQVLQTNPHYLMKISDDPAPVSASNIEYSPTARPAALPDLRSPGRYYEGGASSPHQSQHDLPVYGSALGSSQNFDHGAPVETHLVEMGQTIDHVRRPPGLAHPESYALYVVGDSQSPRFDPGDLIYVNPRRPAAPGDDVVVQLRDELTGEVATALIKRLVRRTASTVTLRQFNPPRDFDVRASLVHAIHRVMPLADLLGS